MQWHVRLVAMHGVFHAHFKAARWPMGSAAFRANVSMITGHFAYGTVESNDKPVVYSTLLREPAKRLASQYVYRPVGVTTFNQFMQRQPGGYCNLQTAQVGGEASGALHSMWMGRYFVSRCPDQSGQHDQEDQIALQVLGHCFLG